MVVRSQRSFRTNQSSDEYRDANTARMASISTSSSEISNRFVEVVMVPDKCANHVP